MRSKNVSRAASLVATVLLMTSCSKSPVTPTGSVTVTTPAQLAPANGASIPNQNQPITLTVSNAFVTESSASVLYTFEVSTDSAFGSKVQTKTAPSGTSQTSVVLDPLAPGQTYFWHSRATGGDTPGTFSPSEKFTVGPAIALGAPGVLAPLTGATPSGWPTFIVTDATRSGPVGTVTYRFEVSNSSTFSSDVLNQTVPETASQTSFTPPLSTTVLVGATLFWRATALDATNGVVSAPSTTQSFVSSQLTRQALIAVQEGFVLWPNAQPPGTNGHAVLGTNWDPQTLVSFNSVTFQCPPLEALREFDLIDRGMDPQAALDWMNLNGYLTTGIWVPSVQVVGYPFIYIALISGTWNLVVRVGG
jgi:hypothetical protein